MSLFRKRLYETVMSCHFYLFFNSLMSYQYFRLKKKSKPNENYGIQNEIIDVTLNY